MTILSARLETILSFCQGFVVLTDIGTDHAYLPIEAIRQGFVKNAVAVDNKLSPLEVARKNISENKLEEKIETVLSDGFANLEEIGDLVVIAGIGGKLTAGILSNGDLEGVKRLVLSPNSEAAAVREWLEQNGFLIADEAFVKDRDKHYQIIVAEKGKMVTTPLEKEFGPVIIKKQSPDFIRYLKGIITKLNKAALLANDPEEKKRILARIKLLEGLIL